MQESLGKPVWISHRGYCDGATENSERAFDQSIELGFQYLETDLRLTSDGHIVLCHDPSFERIGGPETSVNSMTRSEIEALPFGNGHKPLFFDQFIEKYAAYNWTFDIKKETDSHVVKALETWIEENNTEAWFLEHGRFLFWNKSCQKKFLSKFPGAFCYAREDECWRAGLGLILGLGFLAGIKKNKVYSVYPRVKNWNFFNKKTADFFQSRGAKVLAFLPSTEAEEAQVLEAGFDEILTNRKIVK